MKLLVFAHVPPPHHGQSYMVQLMLNGFGGDRRKRRNKSSGSNGYGIECYHVDARFSKSLADVGELQTGKLPLILFYCLQAIWCRFRYGVTHLYYVPAPGKRVALYRDWLIMLICRPFFKKIILHWHAAGLAKWLETSVQIRTRAITYHLFKPVDLSIVLSRYNATDVQKFLSRRIEVVNNGIPDPCPDFEAAILPRRHARFAARTKLLAGESLNAGERAAAGENPAMINVLFLANGLREKGLFATMHGVVIANRTLAARRQTVRLKLIFAGNFMTAEERETFHQLMQDPEFATAVHHAGFVSGDEKIRVLREADVICFPTQYLGENQPVCLIEAMAFGLPIITTRWRSLPEMLPPDYPGLVQGQDPEKIALTLLKMAALPGDENVLRELFLRHFSLEQYLAGMATAIHDLENI
jgi:glycosyltransferase involved in cell wall biosynthesis